MKIRDYIILKMIVVLGALAFGNAAFSQTLMHVLPLRDALSMTVDAAGNIFVAQGDKTIKKWDVNADSVGEYRQVGMGKAVYLDATNPLELLVLYPAFNRMILLDRLMAPKLNFDFSKLGLYNIKVAAHSQDGKYWIYDQGTSQLKKYDASMQMVLASDDLRLSAGMYIQPTQLQEANGYVVLLDPAIGFLLFDRFGNYLSLINHPGAQWFQLYGQQILWWNGDRLQAYDLEKHTVTGIPLPELESDVVGMMIRQDVLYICTAQVLKIYKLEP